MKFRKETEFQETEIGKIPRDWRTFSLKEAFEFYKGTTPSTKDGRYWGGTIPFVTPTDITAINDLNMIYLTKTEKYLTEEGIKSKNLRIVPRGSLLFTSRATIGYLAINNVDATINQGVIALIPKRKDVNILYYYYYLLRMKKKFEELAGGSTYKEISMTMFSKTVIPQPPLQEQNKIANILSTIDRAIELYHGERERLERLKRGLMGELLTGRIRIREENGRLSFYRETEFQETEIGKIPKEWGLAKLEKIAKIITGPFGSQLKKSELTNHGIKVYTQENVLERNFEIGNLYISEEKFKELKNFEVMPDDVLLTIRGTIGKSIKVPTSITKGIIHTNLAIIRLEKKEVLPAFVELVFNESEIWMEQVRRIHSATTIPALYGRTLKQIKIMLPPLNEQKAITHIFSTVNRAIELYREEMTRLERLKRGLMDLLLTGKVRVVDGDVGS